MQGVWYGFDPQLGILDPACTRLAKKKDQSDEEDQEAL